MRESFRWCTSYLNLLTNLRRHSNLKNLCTFCFENFQIELLALLRFNLVTCLPHFCCPKKKDSFGNLRRFVENPQKIVVSDLKTFFFFLRLPLSFAELRGFSNWRPFFFVATLKNICFPPRTWGYFL